jgi:hypothetical protein
MHLLARRSPSASLPVFVLVAALGLAGGGCDDSTDQAEARGRIATAACNGWQECNQIGPGLRYHNRDDCMVRETNSAQNLIPPAQCEGRINQQELNDCLAAIGLIDCGDGLALLAAIAQCSAANVCTGASGG